MEALSCRTERLDCSTTPKAPQQSEEVHGDGQQGHREVQAREGIQHQGTGKRQGQHHEHGGQDVALARAAGALEAEEVGDARGAGSEHLCQNLQVGM